MYLVRVQENHKSNLRGIITQTGATLKNVNFNTCSENETLRGTKHTKRLHSSSRKVFLKALKKLTHDLFIHATRVCFFKGSVT